MTHGLSVQPLRFLGGVLVAAVAVVAVAEGPDDPATTKIAIDALLPAHDHDVVAALVEAIGRLDPTGGVIYLETGGEYEAKSRTPITRAEGDAEIIITTRSGDPATINQHESPGDLLALSGVRNLRIENLRLVGSRASGGNGVVMSDCKGVTLHDVECRDAGGVGVRITNSTKTKLIRVTVNNAKAHGVRIADCTDLTLDDVSVVDAGFYGIGVQNGTQLTRGLKILNSRIIRSGGDGVDIKGQREEGPPLVVIDGLEVIDSGGRKSAALDLRGHVAVKNVRIRLRPGSTGLRFRLGADIGTHEPTNGWAGYGSAEGVTIDSDSPDGIGIVVQSGGVTLNDCSVSGPVEKKVEVYEWANKEQPVVLHELSINGERIADRNQFLASGGSISKQPTLVFE
ncbi:right-handed parallel beta-helix repeat-containing protein [Botrimarina sp.]|uniref:right-handed parallel beta-helix repeat-containing protein n=1 Tax=Botrimarina sp. TaxID=2795802 RepID=UPI0032EE0F77